MESAFLVCAGATQAAASSPTINLRFIRFSSGSLLSRDDLSRHETDLCRRTGVAPRSDFVAHIGDRHLSCFLRDHVQRFLGHRILHFSNDAKNLKRLAHADAVIGPDIQHERTTRHVGYAALNRTYGLL